MASANPYVFIVGCPRSGTTLTERLLDAHSEIAVAHEMRWVPDCFRHRLGVTADGFVTPDIVPVLLSHKRFRPLGIAPEELERIIGSGGATPYVDFVRAIFDLYASARGKRLAGDKTPRYARFIPLLHELFPHARFVHVIRDGRDVFLSAQGWISDAMKGRYPTWASDPALTAGLWWTRNVRMAREAGEALGPRLYLELRYEALVEDVEPECARLCAFLDLPYEPAMLRFYERGAARFQNTRPPRGRLALPVTRGLRDWRSQLSAAELSLFEATGGKLLDELGYERGAPRTNGEIRARAESVRERFGDVIRTRGLDLPRVW